jgi:hypothetical protein
MMCSPAEERGGSGRNRRRGSGGRPWRSAGRRSGGAVAGARLALGRAPPRRSPFIGRGASGSLGAHAKDSRRRPCGLRRSRVRSGLRLGPDGFRGRARGRAGGLGCWAAVTSLDLVCMQNGKFLKLDLNLKCSCNM